MHVIFFTFLRATQRANCDEEKGSQYIEQWEVINNRARLRVDESHSEIVDGDGQLGGQFDRHRAREILDDDGRSSNSKNRNCMHAQAN